jgi:hypothetical protein
MSASQAVEVPFHAPRADTLAALLEVAPAGSEAIIAELDETRSINLLGRVRGLRVDIASVEGAARVTEWELATVQANLKTARAAVAGEPDPNRRQSLEGEARVLAWRIAELEAYLARVPARLEYLRGLLREAPGEALRALKTAQLGRAVGSDGPHGPARRSSWRARL